jgi:dCMP deaminase
MNIPKWDRRFIDMAKLVASWSKDPSTKCGAVVVRPDRTVATVGFNGFPKGVSDADELYADRETKYSRVVHAEQNALLHTGNERLTGFTMYTWPPGFGPTCDRCAAHVIQAGIKHVVHVKNDSDFASRWAEPAQRGLQLYSEAGVEIVSYPLAVYEG